MLRGTLVRDGKLIPKGVYLLTALGALCLLIGLPPLLDALPLLLTGERRRAKVVDVRALDPPVRGQYIADLEFQEKATGRMYRVSVLRRDYRNSVRLRRDQIVQLIYDKQDPNRFELWSVASGWQGGAFAVVLGAGLLLLVWRTPKTG
ncbi:MAG: hypothetical protein JNK48_27020 [Bryobacterales bacterium]|nr:hypothetical protein [Bryobacterales bacterium]